MAIHLEAVPAGFVLRGSVRPGWAYGLRYDFSAFVQPDGEKVMIKAFVGKAPSQSDVRELRRQLNGLGFGIAYWERIDENGVVRLVEMK